MLTALSTFPGFCIVNLLQGSLTGPQFVSRGIKRRTITAHSLNYGACPHAIIHLPVLGNHITVFFKVTCTVMNSLITTTVILLQMLVINDHQMCLFLPKHFPNQLTSVGQGVDCSLWEVAIWILLLFLLHDKNNSLIVKCKLHPGQKQLPMAGDKRANALCTDSMLTACCLYREHANSMLGMGTDKNLVLLIPLLILLTGSALRVTTITKQHIINVTFVQISL